MRSYCLAVLGAAAAVQVNGVVVMSQGAAKIVPKLENVASDKKFFGPPFPADYPDDRQPKVGTDLKPQKRASIYPKIEDHGFLDHDYVHDENGDGGEWEAQMAYDNARAKYNKENQLSDAAQKRLREEAKDADAAAKRAKDADAAEDAAEKDEKEAEAAEKKADDVVKELEGAAKKAAEEAKKHAKEIAKKNFTAEEIKKKVAESDKELKEAQDEYKKAEEAFKECQKKFDEAKAELVKRQHVHDAYVKKQAEVNAKDMDMKAPEDFTDELRVARSKAEAAKAKKKAAKAEEDAMDAKEDTFEAEYKRQKQQEDDAEALAEQAEHREKEAAKELEAAKQHLRNIRNPTPAPKSGSAAMAASPFMLLAACAMLLW